MLPAAAVRPQRYVILNVIYGGRCVQLSTAINVRSSPAAPLAQIKVRTHTDSHKVGKGKMRLREKTRQRPLQEARGNTRDEASLGNTALEGPGDVRDIRGAGLTFDLRWYVRCFLWSLRSRVTCFTLILAFW